MLLPLTKKCIKSKGNFTARGGLMGGIRGIENRHLLILKF